MIFFLFHLNQIYRQNKNINIFQKKLHNSIENAPFFWCQIVAELYIDSLQKFLRLLLLTVFKIGATICWRAFLN